MDKIKKIIANILMFCIGIANDVLIIAGLAFIIGASCEINAILGKLVAGLILLAIGIKMTKK